MVAYGVLQHRFLITDMTLESKVMVNYTEKQFQDLKCKLLFHFLTELFIFSTLTAPCMYVTAKLQITAMNLESMSMSNNYDYSLVICNHCPQPLSRADMSRANALFYFWISPIVWEKCPGSDIPRQTWQYNVIVDCRGELPWFNQLAVPSVPLSITS